MKISRSISAGLAGGFLAGAVVGAAEALVAWTHAHGTGELPPLAWALVVYGLVGAVGGFVAGILSTWLDTDAFGLGVAAVGMALALVVGRFRVVRDVFMEQSPAGLRAAVVQLGVFAVAVVVGVWLWRALRGVTARGSWVTRPIYAAAIVGAAAIAWGGWSATRHPVVSAPATVQGKPSANAPNVILIAVDTLRADHLSCYGYAAIATPHVDGLAADGVRFANAFSQASWTRPSMATILTGLYPSSHTTVHKADRLPDRVETLAERLGAAGYYTAGFVDNANLAPGFNFQQGFVEYRFLAPDLFFFADEPAAQLTLYSGLRLVRERFLARYVDVRNYYQPGETVRGEVEGWLANGAERRPFFLFVHFMDPHDPYFVHPYNGEGYARVAYPNPSPAEAEKLRRLYDGEIVYLDAQLGLFFDTLRKRGLYDDALIILTADHGEEFHEHGGWWHGTTLYDEQMHVPLIVKLPAGRAKGEVVSALATSLDIVPTVLATAGVGVPTDLPGRVLPHDDRTLPARDSVFAEEDFEGNLLAAVRTPAWKLIAANAGNPRGLKSRELYDLGADPGEQHDEAASKPTERETMEAAMGRATLEARAHTGAAEAAEVDEAAKERLRALGYLK